MSNTMWFCVTLLTGCIALGFIVAVEMGMFDELLVRWIVKPWFVRKVDGLNMDSDGNFYIDGPLTVNINGVAFPVEVVFHNPDTWQK